MEMISREKLQYIYGCVYFGINGNDSNVRCDSAARSESIEHDRNRETSRTNSTERCNRRVDGENSRVVGEDKKDS